MQKKNIKPLGGSGDAEKNEGTAVDALKGGMRQFTQGLANAVRPAPTNTAPGKAMAKGVKNAVAAGNAAAPANTRKAQKLDKRPTASKKAATPDSGVRVARDMTDQLLSKQYENTAPQRKRSAKG